MKLPHLQLQYLHAIYAKPGAGRYLLMHYEHLMKQTACLMIAGTNTGPRTLSYNPAENAVLLTSDQDGGSYELYLIPKDANGSAVVTLTTHPSHLLTH